MSAKFVHLHTHSHYSLLDGLSKIGDLVKKCVEYEMPAMALTDHGNMYGAIEFYKKATAAGIKPIIGVEAYMAARSRFQKEANIDSKRFHLTLLAKDETGYRNLMRLVSKSYLEGYYYKPRIDRELLKEHHEGIICLSGCMGGELSRLVWNKHYDEAKALARDYQEIFGKENYFIEIMHHPKIERAMEIKADLIKLAHELDIQLVATYDSHYISKDDNAAHNTLVAIQSNTDVGDTKRFNNPDEDFSFISPLEAAEFYADAPESVTNTTKIADMCNLTLDLGKWTFPNFEIPEGSNYDGELRRKAEEGLATYLAEHPEADPKITVERMNYELEVIKNKGYSPYFLVVSDLINFARSQKIFNNTRGSAAGSFVSFLIKITDVDPLYYKLPFERFLNPDRPSAPDIDMDYADKRRDEIIDYARRKYGDDHVAQIGTFGSMLAKGSVRDVARTLGYPYAIGDGISNMIPLGSQGFPMTIARAMEMVPELKEDYEKSADTKKVIDLALKIEGCARHISVHAAGVVISPTIITDFVPVQLDPKGGKTITQYDMHAVEDAGLLKYDFLGIRNLSILEDSIRIVRKTRGVEIDIQKIPLDDQKTFEMLARGETYGLFQLGGAGMT
ncbi:MAG: DNA polymerase III subunit alpha, partial [bacterium]